MMTVDKILSNMSLRFQIFRKSDLTIKTKTGIIAVVKHTAIII